MTDNTNPGLFSIAPAISSDGTLTYTPAGNANGSATITVVAHDGGGTANGGVDASGPQTFTITVNAVNDAPSFTKGDDQTVNEDAGAQTVANWATGLSVGPASESSQTLNFQVADNTNPDLFSVAPAISSTGTLTYTPAGNANGSATITVVAHDGGGTANGGVDTSDPQTFTITVNAVNDAPSFAKGSDQTVNEDAGAQTVANWATGLSVGPANESSQTLNFEVTGNTNSTLFSTAPAILSDGTLTYTPAANANGSATITVVAHDDGGTANGGVDTSNPQTFTITVSPADDAPTIDAISAPDAFDENAGLQTISLSGLTAGFGESQPFLVTAISGNTDLIPDPTVDYTWQNTTGSLSFAALPDAIGTADITVSVSDAGLDGILGSSDDHVTQRTFTVTVTSSARVTAATVTGHSVELDLSVASQATDVMVLRSRAPDDGFAGIGTVSPGSPFTDTGVVPDSSDGIAYYWYRVHATGDSNYSTYSAVAQACVLSSPGAVAATQDGTSPNQDGLVPLELSWWSAPVGLTDFIIEKSDTATFDSPVQFSPNPDGHSFTGMVAPGVAWYYRVAAIHSETVNGVTMTSTSAYSETEVMALAAPTLTAVAASATEVAISAPAGTILEKYDSETSSWMAFPGVETAPGFYFDTVSEHSTNAYRGFVTSDDGTMRSPYGDPVTVITPYDDVTPTAVVQGPNTVTLTWTAKDAAHITVTRAADGETPVILDEDAENVSHSGDLYTYIDAEAPEGCGITYSVTVERLDSAFNTPAGAVTVTTPWSAPVVDAVWNGEDQRIDVTWTYSGLRNVSFAVDIQGWHNETSDIVGPTVRSDSYPYLRLASLMPGGTFFCRVDAVVLGPDGGILAHSGQVLAPPVTIPPVQPTLSPEVETGFDSVSLAWEMIGECSSFRVERSVDGGATWDSAGVIGKPYSGTTVNFTDFGLTDDTPTQGLTDDTSYRYRVVTIGTDSQPSDIDPNAFVVGTTAVAPPTPLEVTRDGETVTLRWINNSSHAATMVVDGQDQGTTAAGAQGSYAFQPSGFDSEQQHSWALVARSQVTDVESGAATIWYYPRHGFLGASSGSETSVSLSWSGLDATGEYSLERSTSGYFTTYATLASDIDASGPQTYTDQSLDPGTYYIYRLHLVGEGHGHDAVAGAATQLCGPTGLSAAAVSGQRRIDLSWTDNSNYEDGYLVERSKNGGAFAQVASVGANVATYSDTGLAPGQTYAYRVRAYRGTQPICSDYANSTPVQLPQLTSMTVNSTGDWEDVDDSDGTAFTGNTVNGNSECTLRAAITWANATPGIQDIYFDPAVFGSGATISTSGLIVTDPANIHGLPGGEGEPPLVTLAGGLLTISAGGSTIDTLGFASTSGTLLTTAGGNTLSNLVLASNPATIGISVQGCSGITISHAKVSGRQVGILLEGSGDNTISDAVITDSQTGIRLVGASGNPIQTAHLYRNAIGLDITAGTGAAAGSENNTVTDVDVDNAENPQSPTRNGTGVRIDGSPANTIDGGTIKNTTNGIAVTGGASDYNMVMDVVLTNNETAITVADHSTRAIILANQISDCGAGVVLASGATGTRVQGNTIEGDPESSGNTYGIAISGGAHDNIIGRDGDGIGDESEGNTILHNTGDGISVAGTDTTGNSIRGNSIHDNGGQGIDIGDDDLPEIHDLAAQDGHGPNAHLGLPVLLGLLAEPGTTSVWGHWQVQMAPNTPFTVDFYSNATPDASGYGEGETWVGSF
ncbi:MAG: right-handed parallel beta-helix repeat-containing protein, partial [Phycisphaerae bacterium]|nr:right-handed parallel beta-helix repeat-containing protein [Phycisphaerae bacterium]